MRYYSTQRPVGPGTFPRPKGNKVVELHNFDSKTYCEEIGREAWGFIDYEQPLTPMQVASYELKAAGLKMFTVEVTTVHTLEIEAENEDEAIEKACGIAWEYDADSIDGNVLEGGERNG